MPALFPHAAHPDISQADFRGLRKQFVVFCAKPFPCAYAAPNPDNKGSLMKLAVVTICYNSAKTIERTIQSVVNQKVPLEYIIVDGGSSDGTVDIVKKYFESGFVTKYISEKDAGISDAFNKGIAMSTADVIGLLNSDDWYVPGALGKIVRFYDRHGTGFILHGNMIRVKEEKRERIRPRPLPRLWLYVDCPFNHPAVFVPKKIYDKVMPYSREYRYAMDYDFYVRAMRSGVEFRYIDDDIAFFSTEGISSQSAGICHREVLKIQEANGMPMPLCYFTYSMKMIIHFAKRTVNG
jgi:glycosyltransferase involved in cell wall biosynthesis